MNVSRLVLINIKTTTNKVHFLQIPFVWRHFFLCYLSKNDICIAYLLYGNEPCSIDQYGNQKLSILFANSIFHFRINRLR